MSTSNTSNTSPYFSVTSNPSYVGAHLHNYADDTESGSSDRDQDITKNTLSTIATRSDSAFSTVGARWESDGHEEHGEGVEDGDYGEKRMLEAEANRWDIEDEEETEEEEELEEVEEPPTKRIKLFSTSSNTTSPHFVADSRATTTLPPRRVNNYRNAVSSTSTSTDNYKNWTFTIPSGSGMRNGMSGADFESGRRDGKRKGYEVDDEGHGEEVRNDFRGMSTARSTRKATPTQSDLRETPNSSPIKTHRGHQSVEIDLEEVDYLARSPTTYSPPIDIPTITITPASPDLNASPLKRKRDPPLLARQTYGGLKPLAFWPPPKTRPKQLSFDKEEAPLLGNMGGWLPTGASRIVDDCARGMDDLDGSVESGSDDDEMVAVVASPMHGVSSFQCLPAKFFSVLGVVLRENHAIDDLARLNVCSRSIYHATKKELWRQIWIPHEGANWDNAVHGWNNDERAGVEAWLPSVCVDEGLFEGVGQLVETLTVVTTDPRLFSTWTLARYPHYFDEPSTSERIPNWKKPLPRHPRWERPIDYAKHFPPSNLSSQIDIAYKCFPNLRSVNVVWNGTSPLGMPPATRLRYVWSEVKTVWNERKTRNVIVKLQHLDICILKTDRGAFKSLLKDVAGMKSLHIEVNCVDVCKVLYESTEIGFFSYHHSDKGRAELELLATWDGEYEAVLPPDVREACTGNKVVTDLDLVGRDHISLYPVMRLVLLARDHFAATLQVLTIEVQVPHTAWYDHHELEDTAEICCHIPFLRRLDVTYRSSYDIFFRSNNGTIPSGVRDTCDLSQADKPTRGRTGKIAMKISGRCLSFTMFHIRCKRDFYPGGWARKEEGWVGTQWECCAKIDAKNGHKKWDWKSYQL